MDIYINLYFYFCILQVRITKKVHSLAKDNVFKSAQCIVEDVVRTDLATDTPSIINPANLIRSSNRQRQKERLLPIQCQLVAEEKLRRYQRTQTRLFQGKVTKL